MKHCGLKVYLQILILVFFFFHSSGTFTHSAYPYRIHTHTCTGVTELRRARTEPSLIITTRNCQRRLHHNVVSLHPSSRVFTTVRTLLSQRRARSSVDSSLVLRTCHSI
ncbi:hypothetical protein BaRGS_00007185 [Batillaria attramentaria]|uniref:Secreted protein n=1 Tax=Batillaria attramentaria TaxID=370345 RepID=A0ABD0LPZ5_9CAEN